MANNKRARVLNLRRQSRAEGGGNSSETQQKLATFQVSGECEPFSLKFHFSSVSLHQKFRFIKKNYPYILAKIKLLHSFHHSLTQSVN